MRAEPHRKIGERSLEILESAIDREDLLVDCAPLRDGGGIEGKSGLSTSYFGRYGSRPGRRFHLSYYFSRGTEAIQ